MGLSSDQYAEQLDALLPKGLAWPRESDARMRALTQGLAIELSRVDARGDDLLSEVLPSSTLEMLSDWERAVGLPDPCVPDGSTLQERRAALITRLTSTGGQSRAFFIALAESFGYTITITEFRPFRVGVSAVGDALYGDDWMYAWRINAPETTVVYFRVGVSAVGEPLRKWGNELLECVFNRIKPAHTILIFGYSS